jgi:hypothetical protein
LGRIAASTIKEYEMPICEGCGGSYDDQFKFCPYCGRAKPESKDININVNISSSDVWEICEIKVVSDQKNKLLFEAIAIGPKGRYGAAWSEPLTPPPGLLGLLAPFWVNHEYDYDYDQNKNLNFYKGAHAKFNAFVNKLVKDGWQPTGRGQEWYGEKFRRKV